ncbi:ABC transporter substrate binding protein [Lactobacillus delbrueckii subsp. bulgaricus]|uniref:ABC transporter substrate binding protein n=1 Tax=Lactobacillus delbrueckii TaxID=1584 RepID=UPI0022AE56D4|nr:ABC transporter substrate binding protein [Lactobacillus delbrueckii]
MVQHEALDAATKGFKEEVTKELGKSHVKFDTQNAQGDSSTATTICNNFASENEDLILGKKLNFAGHLAFVVIGAIIYYIVYTLVLWLKMNPNMMKLFTAIIVALFLAVPYLRSRAKNSFAKAGKNARKGA